MQTHIYRIFTKKKNFCYTPIPSFGWLPPNWLKKNNLFIAIINLLFVDTKFLFLSPIPMASIISVLGDCRWILREIIRWLNSNQKIRTDIKTLSKPSVMKSGRFAYGKKFVSLRSVSLETHANERWEQYRRTYNVCILPVFEVFVDLRRFYLIYLIDLLQNVLLKTINIFFNASPVTRKLQSRVDELKMYHLIWR